MLIKIEPSSGEPLFSQIAGQLRGQISDGGLPAGGRLPPARELARVLEVNMHTVLRAYAQLRDEQLVEMRRGRGVHVRPGAASRAGLVGQAKSLAQEARRHGLTRAEVMGLIEEEL